MIRLRPLTSILVMLATSISFLQAQEPTPGPSSTPASAQEDIRAMRQMLEQQSQKIESLSQQVTKLNQELEAEHPVEPAPSPAQAAVSSEPAAKPTVEVKPDPVAPKAEPVTPTATPAVTHVVARGETLTYIAKHYKTSVADLLKANKIEDDRKLQIGQVLTIPPPKETEPPTTK